MANLELTQFIQCDIEIEGSGPTQKVVAGWVANALRGIAEKLERGEYEDGHHDLELRSGKKLGSVYFDFSEGEHFDDLDAD
ncbi:hypothetical protein [Leisingera sp. JC11]|uniref:hypothetical protein n=1 Tax=Leisingera sp. JC11 TaxID=3042469 RepID=UPI003456F814